MVDVNKEIKICSVDDCDRPARGLGLCSAHYQRMRLNGTLERKKPDYSCTPCSVDECGKQAKSNGMCISHYNAFNKYGRTEILVKKGHNKGLSCSIDGCEKPARKTGLCQNHYEMQRKYGRTEKKTKKVDQPLYRIWVDKQVKRILCEKWADFWTFAKDVGERPEGNFFLERKTEGLFGPDNFEWKEKLQKHSNESDSEWHARKWQDRKEKYPEFERIRHLKRHFGITKDDYIRMYEEQGGVCAICKQPENFLDKNTGKVRNLAVDHNHTTGKVRALLCFGCNSTVGRIEENIDRLPGIDAYLKQHNS